MKFVRSRWRSKSFFRQRARGGGDAVRQPANPRRSWGNGFRERTPAMPFVECRRGKRLHPTAIGDRKTPSFFAAVPDALEIEKTRIAPDPGFR